MSNRLQKRWVFTWNSDDGGFLPSAKKIVELLNKECSEAVFQLEAGSETGRLHYQGRFTLKGPRMGKRALLKLFGEVFNTKQLTIQPEISFNSSSYCEKSDTRVEGPWYAGLQSYINTKEVKPMTLRDWQSQLLELMTGPLRSTLEDRKVIWIQDPDGGSGKSSFIRFLAMNEKKTGLAVEKMPFDRPDRLRSSIIKLSKKKDVDVYMFDFTRTQGEETSLRNLFEVVEEIKNGYIVDVMYGNYNKAFPKEAMVIIFTNEDINDHLKYLSNDRWQVFTVIDQQLIHRDVTNPTSQFLESTNEYVERMLKGPGGKPEPKSFLADDYISQNKIK